MDPSGDNWSENVVFPCRNKGIANTERQHMTPFNLGYAQKDDL